MSTSKNNITEPTPEPPLPNFEHQVVFVIDGVVQETVSVGGRFAAILLSEPLIVDTSLFHSGQIKIGYAYDLNIGQFRDPEGNIIISPEG
jgi:hypothetical protein